MKIIVDVNDTINPPSVKFEYVDGTNVGSLCSAIVYSFVGMMELLIYFLCVALRPTDRIR